MNLNWRFSDAGDLELLVKWNKQLIEDEQHRNRMTLSELKGRMRSWLIEEYQAVIFSFSAPVAYALYKNTTDGIYLRQFFVDRNHRRQSIGSTAIGILRNTIWPADVRLMVDVLCKNREGIDFWKAVGYSEYCLTLEIAPQ
ncbi:MAG: GNAT family N-acetyltransferase [Spirochaetales bacterium]|nr:GNAT family N-acetyltransferase [Spirochaetales bacterium]